MAWSSSGSPSWSPPWPLSALLVWGGAWIVFSLLPWPELVRAGAATMVSIAASMWGQTWWRRVFLAAGFPLSLLVLRFEALPAWAWLLGLGALLLIYPLNAWRDAPVFPTPSGALDELAPLLDLPQNDDRPLRILDAGCGLGDGLIALRRAWPDGEFFGLEWSWALRLVCGLRCRWARVRQGDLWFSSWREYDIVYMFQRPESMPRAQIKVLSMRSGSWFISLNFPLPSSAEPTHTVFLPDGRPLYAYRVPISESVDSSAIQRSSDGHPPVRAVSHVLRRRPPPGRSRHYR